MLEYCSAEISELAKALIAVQRELLPAARDGTNPFTRSNYATLNSVMEACRDVLLAHGIWMTQLPVPAPVELGPGHIGLLTKLTHAESGQWQSSLAVVPLPKADPQGMGSAITYARRYALTAMLGIITEEDDDGEAVQGQRSPPLLRNQLAVCACRPSEENEYFLRQRGAAEDGPFEKRIRCRGLPAQG